MHIYQVTFASVKKLAELLEFEVLGDLLKPKALFLSIEGAKAAAAEDFALVVSSDGGSEDEPLELVWEQVDSVTWNGVCPEIGESIMYQIHFCQIRP